MTLRRRVVPGPAGRISCLWGEADSPHVPVVFVHGINGAATQWSSVIDQVTEREVLAVDLRGHGGSEPGGCYGAADYAADVSAAMSAVGITRAHLVGASFGGGVCVTLAAAEPDRVASLTIIGGALGIGAASAGSDVEAAVAALRQVGLESFFEQAAAVGFGPNTDDEMLRESVRLALGRDIAVIEAVLRAALTSDVSAAAAQTTAPARVLTGEHDRTCPPELGAALAASLQADCTVLPGLGHMAHIEDPEQIAGLLAAHLDHVERPGQAHTVRGC